MTKLPEWVEYILSTPPHPHQCRPRERRLIQALTLCVEALSGVIKAGTKDQSKEQPGLCMAYSTECEIAKEALAKFERLGVEK